MDVFGMDVLSIAAGPRQTLRGGATSFWKTFAATGTPTIASSPRVGEFCGFGSTRILRVQRAKSNESLGDANANRDHRAI
jgi:hypothetical protein